MSNLYTYRAQVVRVIDGDTVVMDIDLGLNTWLRRQHIRLAGINAPEIRGEERPQGLAAMVYLIDALQDVDTLTIRTVKDKAGKYGRYLAELFLPDGRSINQMMIKSGNARAYP